MSSRDTNDPKVPTCPPDIGRNRTLRIPSSHCRGIRWPALPNRNNARVLALLYQLEQSQWWPAKVVLEHQMLQLEHLLSHAASTVPFHERLRKELKGLQRGALTIDVFRGLPIMARGDIQEAGTALNSRRLPKDHGSTSEVSTSGSTGRPITVKKPAVTGLFDEALTLRCHLWHNRDFSAKFAAIHALRGNSARAAERGTSVQWVPGFVSGPMMHFDVARPVREQLDWLTQQNPDYLLTYPTNLRALLEYSENTGQRPETLVGVLTLGELLEPAVRAACERVWNVAVSDVYSAQELGMIALQCPEYPHYHVQAENVLVEVLGEDGKPCVPGKVGRLVMSHLHNFATPLIRYEIGDYAVVGEACPCGRGLPVIHRIVGRVHNMLTLPSGEEVWPVPFYSNELLAAAPVRQIQLVQRSLEEIEVKLATARPLSAEEEAALRHLITGRLGHPFVLRFIYVDEIPRSPNGKYEDFRSDVSSGAAADHGSR